MGVEFGVPTLGLITVIPGMPAATLNVADADSEPVVTVTVVAPMSAPVEIVTGAESSVGPLTDMVPTVASPLANVTVVVPCTKCVYAPFTIKVNDCPCSAMVGLVVMVGTPDCTVN